MVVQAYILIQTEVGQAAEVAREIAQLAGVTLAEDVTGPVRRHRARGGRQHRRARPPGRRTDPGRQGHHPHAHVHRRPRLTGAAAAMRAAPRAAAMLVAALAGVLPTTTAPPTWRPLPSPAARRAPAVVDRAPRTVLGPRGAHDAQAVGRRRLGRPADRAAVRGRRSRRDRRPTRAHGRAASTGCGQPGRRGRHRPRSSPTAATPAVRVTVPGDRGRGAAARSPSSPARCRRCRSQRAERRCRRRRRRRSARQLSAGRCGGSARACSRRSTRSA